MSEKFDKALKKAEEALDKSRFGKNYAYVTELRQRVESQQKLIEQMGKEREAFCRDRDRAEKSMLRIADNYEWAMNQYNKLNKQLNIARECLKKLNELS